MSRRIYLLLTGLFLFTSTFGQSTVEWPTPEVEQMYKQAKEHLSRGAIDQSIIVFRQAIQLAPSVNILYRDLAQALNIKKDYKEAYKVIEPLVKDDKADEMTYQIAATALIGQNERKRTKNLLEKGLKAYPNSGILYYELGKYHEANDEMEYALDAVLQGIQVDPIYHLNYYSASRYYFNTSKPIWTIIYGEIFCNIERYTNRSNEVRKMILQAYQKLYGDPAALSVPKYGTAITAGEEESFEAAVMQLMMPLAPVVSDGVTTENLIMLRTRFVMDWNNTFADKYPFSLFFYHNKMLREGKFDAYNQWMFGNAENPNTYSSWTKFHTHAIPDFEKWLTGNQYKPLTRDFYNNKDLRKLFVKKKK